MSGSRDRVMANIRASLERSGPLPASVTRGLDARLKRPAANLKPKLAGNRVGRFKAKVEAAGGRFETVARLADVAGVVESIIDRFELPARVVAAPDPALEGIPWSNRLSVDRRAAEDTDTLSISAAFAGASETGTVALVSGAESPSTLAYLPGDHVVVLRRANLVNHLEDIWGRLRKRAPAMPRAVHLVTGPSKTADVEQTLQEGAHGPRRLHVLLVEGDD